MSTHGHAAHFLSRLDRVEHSQVELALALYEHPALLAATLREAHLPAGAERVAISLEDPTEGPFVIVTRDGHFVTCLGKGMRPRHPVVTRDVLARIARRVTALSDAMAEASHEAAKGRGRLTKLFGEVLHAGPYVSRETIESLTRWRIVLGPAFLRQWRRVAVDVAKLQPKLEAAVRRNYRDEGVLRTYYDVVHSLAHFGVLAAASGIGPTELPEPAELSSSFGHAVSFMLFTHDDAYLAHRALWAVGSMCSLEPFAAHARGAQEAWQLGHGMLGTAAIGLRQPDARPFALRTIEIARPSPADDRHVPARVPLYRATLRMAFAEPERLQTRALARGRGLYAERAGVAREEVADSTAVAALASAAGPIVRCYDSDVLASATAAGVLAKREPHELYLTRAELRAWRRPWQLADGLALMPPRVARRPVRAEPAPGRNELCRCGSGRKSKRCCASSSRKAA